jgi:hypothetical protein
MKIKYFGLLVLGLVFVNQFSLRAQGEGEKEETRSKLSGRPDIPGVLGFDYGWVTGIDIPEEMKLKFFTSNVYRGFYKFDINVGDSKLSVHPGLGFTVEKYTFKENVTIRAIAGDAGYQNVLVGLDTIVTDENIKKTQMVPVYLDIPLEFTFRTNREQPKRAFKFTLGIIAGLRLDNKTKLKYTQDGEKKRTKQKENFGANWYRINAITRIGYGSINAFYSFSLTPLFEKNKGPLGTAMQPMTFGLSLDLF